MRVRTNKLFPYPVLSEFNDSYKDNTFSCETNFEYDSVNGFFTFSYSLNDEKILKFLKEGKVGLYFVVDCSETKYRELFSVELDDGKNAHKEIPLEKLNGSFELVSILISKEDICDYSNENLSDLYDGETVNLPKNSIIGFTETEVFYLNKKIDANGDIPSIFKICSDLEGKDISFEQNGEYVMIYLPKVEYEKYNEYRGKGKRLKQMMIDFPVLVSLLNVIKQGEADYSDKPWFNALDSALEKKGYDGGLESDRFKNESSMKVAQDILGNLIQDAFVDFDKFLEE